MATSSRVLLTLVLVLPTTLASSTTTGTTLFDQAVEVIKREMKMKMNRRLGDNDTAAPTNATEVAPADDAPETAEGAPPPGGDCFTVCKVSEIAGRRRLGENDTAPAANATAPTEEAAPAPAPAEEAATTEEAAPPPEAAGGGEGEEQGPKMEVLCSVIECMVTGEGKEICGDMKDMIMNNPQMPPGLYDCVCKTEGIMAAVGGLMSAGTKEGVCADAAKNEKGDIDVCKLDPAGTCATTMGTAMKQLQDTEACAGMADKMMEDSSAEEKDCSASIIGSLTQTTTNAPSPPDAAADLGLRRTGTGTAAFAAAAALLLVGPRLF